MKPKKLACLLRDTVLKKQLKDKMFFFNLLVEEHSNDSVNFYYLSRRALSILFPELSDFIVNYKSKSVQLISSTILRQKLTINFACDLHKQKVQNVVISIVVNIFFNDKRRLLYDVLKVILYPALKSDNVLNKLRLTTKCAYFSISVYFSNLIGAYSLLEVL